MPELKVGQKLYRVPIGRRNGSPCEVMISKIGHKWATYTLHGRDSRVDKETLYEDGGQYSSPAKCYLSAEAYEHEKQHAELWSHIYERISHTAPECSMESLVLIAELLNIKLPGGE